MPAKKIRDLAVKTGSYTVNGEQKNRYKNVGSLMKTDDGNTFILLDTTFNPAGVPNPDCLDNVLISVFELREEGEKPQRQAAKPAYGQKSAPAADVSGDDSIPF